MKIFVIASTEYASNMPDLFLMDAEGNYYGVGPHSYVPFHNYPKDIEHWLDAHCSDIDRLFNIDEVELPVEKVEEFDRLTKEYMKMDAEEPEFGHTFPVRKDYKSKKDYDKAVADFEKQYRQWYADLGIANYVLAKEDLWTQRTKLFCSFSEKVTDAISDNECIQNP